MTQVGQIKSTWYDAKFKLKCSNNYIKYKLAKILANLTVRRKLSDGIFKSYNYMLFSKDTSEVKDN